MLRSKLRQNRITDNCVEFDNKLALFVLKLPETKSFRRTKQDTADGIASAALGGTHLLTVTSLMFEAFGHNQSCGVKVRQYAHGMVSGPTFAMLKTVLHSASKSRAHMHCCGQT